MLSLYCHFGSLGKFFFLWLYLVSSQVFFLVSFYPRGLFLATLIVVWIYFMFYTVSTIFRTYIHFYNYYVIHYLLSLTSLQTFFTAPLGFFVQLILKLLYFFSQYYYVWWVNRINFYLFIFVTILVYIS